MRDAGGVDIEVLVVPDCPNEKTAVDRLRHALTEVGLGGVGFTTRVIADQAEAERCGYAHASPGW
ncbi:hypothetical protein NRF20_03275 [Streptomyces sp. R-74717]|uniref:hypothetical protein n=1 Tax=Streptomyces sp. R-74717 TaxID=2969820 RepID=UPI0039B4212E